MAAATFVAGTPKLNVACLGGPDSVLAAGAWVGCSSVFGTESRLALDSLGFPKIEGAGLALLDGAGEASLDGLREEDGLSKLADAFKESKVLPERFFRRGTEPMGFGRPRLLLGCFVVDGIRIRPLFY